MRSNVMMQSAMHGLETTRPVLFRVILAVAAAALACAALGMPVARAQTADGGAPGDWLSLYAGARTVGLGGAFTAVADAPSGLLWNPAGAARLGQFELEAGTVRLFDDTSINTFGAVMPAGRRMGLGLTLLTLGSGEFERTTELNEPLGEFTERDFAGLLTGAVNVTPRWAVGAGVKIVRQRVEDYSATGTGLSLGALGEVTPDLQVGASVANLGGPTLRLRQTEESYPVELRAGAALRLFHGNGLVTGEVAHREGPGTEGRAGAEVWLLERLGLRVGYYAGNPAGGFSYRLPTGLQFDYGVTDHVLGVTHRFGFTYRFGGYRATAQAEPAVFSPTGKRPVTKFLLTARTRADARDWELTLWNKSDEVVRRFGGQGVPPAHVLWDGKDETGLPLPDGIYTYRLTVHDREGRAIESRELTVEIFTGGPEGEVPVEIQ
jgi:hypothetical protein